jgi:hypothetical protein
MNSRAERANSTLTEMARSLLLQSKLPESFWAEAINCAAYIRNRCPTKGVNENKTPYERFFGYKPTVSYFKIFGQKCFVLNKRSKGKFDPRSQEHIFIGYSNESKAYRLWNKNSRKIIISRDVRFIDEFENNNSPCNSEIELIFPFETVNQNSERPETMADDAIIKTESEESTEGEQQSQKGDANGNFSSIRSRLRARKINTGTEKPRKEYKIPQKMKFLKLLISILCLIYPTLS